MTTYRSIPEADALRMALALERAAHAETRAELEQLQAQAQRQAAAAIRARHGLEGYPGTVVLEPGGAYPPGTLLDAQGRPVPAEAPAPELTPDPVPAAEPAPAKE